MDAVAKSLDFKFDHFDLDAKNLNPGIEKVSQILKGPKSPDAIVLVGLGESTKTLVDAAEQAHIAIFIQKALDAKDLEWLGAEPRVKYKHWIASFHQDEHKKGYDSARALFNCAMKTFKGQAKIHLVAISGDEWIGTKQRLEGMKDALKDFPQIELKEVAPTNWTAQSGRSAAEKLLRDVPDVKLVWAASDELAINALDAARNAGHKPGDDIKFSGIDMSTPALEHVQKEEIEATSAMSMMGFAELMIYAYDYLEGIDFAPEVGTAITPHIYTATHRTAHEHLELYKRIDQLDFKRFSKSYNPGLRHYNMMISAFMDAVGMHICSPSHKARDLCYRPADLKESGN